MSEQSVGCGRCRETDYLMATALTSLSIDVGNVCKAELFGEEPGQALFHDGEADFFDAVEVRHSGEDFFSESKAKIVRSSPSRRVRVSVRRSRRIRPRSLVARICSVMRLTFSANARPVAVLEDFAQWAWLALGEFLQVTHAGDARFEGVNKHNVCTPNSFAAKVKCQSS
ncbi:hypothetical protein EMGBD2_18430 [Nitrospirota bacterium]|nr:hypothetical protein EMGBD2_18430 [Nitrospirota bacterium]